MVGISILVTETIPVRGSFFQNVRKFMNIIINLESVMGVKTDESHEYNIVAELILQHIGIIIFVSTIILAKLGMFPMHPLLIVVGSISGVWGVFEMIGSKFKIIAALGWILAFSLLMSGNGVVLSGF